MTPARTAETEEEAVWRPEGDGNEAVISVNRVTLDGAVSDVRGRGLQSGSSEGELA